VSIEDGAEAGGAGSAVAEWMQKESVQIQLVICAIPDLFIDHATREEMLETAELDEKNILKKIEKFK